METTAMKSNLYINLQIINQINWDPELRKRKKWIIWWNKIDLKNKHFLFEYDSNPLHNHCSKYKDIWWKDYIIWKLQQ